MNYFLDQYRNLHLGQNIFKTFLSDPPDTLGKQPTFYQKLIKDWIILTDNNRQPVTDLAYIYHEPIFHNRNINTETHDTLPQTIKPPNWYQTVNTKSLTTVIMTS